MKKINYIVITALLCVVMSSCASSYNFCQVYETKPVKQSNQLKYENGGMSYENAQCSIDYCFWSNGGNADFNFYNKTDDIIYIDLAKSFYVMNGVAYDLFLDREWTQSSSVGVASSVFYGYGESRSVALSVARIEPSLTTDGLVTARATKTAGRSANITSGRALALTESSSVTVKEKKIIVVPPHSKKYIKTYSIATTPMLSCDLQRYPSQSARLEFTAENSPYCFSDVITYFVGDNTQSTTVKNDFYVSSVTNYAEPEIVIMQKREELCENMRDMDYVAPSQDLYDKVIRGSICETASSFYNTYQTKTNKKLYEKKESDGYSYNSQYQAYVRSKSQGEIGVSVVIGIIGMFAAGALLIANGY